MATLRELAERVSVPVWGMGCIGKTVQICRIRLVKFLQLVFDIIAQNPLHDKEFCPLSTKSFLLIWRLSGANLSFELEVFSSVKEVRTRLCNFRSILICFPQNPIACVGLGSNAKGHQQFFEQLFLFIHRECYGFPT